MEWAGADCKCSLRTFSGAEPHRTGTSPEAALPGAKKLQPRSSKLQVPDKSQSPSSGLSGRRRSIGIWNAVCRISAKSLSGVVGYGRDGEEAAPDKKMILSSMILSASLLMPNRPDGKDRIIEDRIIFLVDVPRPPGCPGPANLKSFWVELGTWNLEIILSFELCPLSLHPHCPLRCQARPFGR